MPESESPESESSGSESQPQQAQFPEADGGGGRSGRGPATHVPGTTEPGGVVPPYEGRREEADMDEVHRKAHSRSPEASGMSSPAPEDTPGGRTASPADEQPAADMPETKGDDAGVGPAHVKGVPPGESHGS